jgi:D-glycero-alpha-D-manno-heptose-7-phosphate kinase
MIISKTPLRISFVGGGTDISDYYKRGYGAVVSAAIDRYIYVTVHERFDSSIRVSYTKTEIVEHVDDLEHEIINACLQRLGVRNGIEITTIGEIPAGAGLGSSSALTVGLLNALYRYVGRAVTAKELFDQACEIEIDVLKAPIGKQDQAASAFGGLNYFRFNADGSVERRAIDLSEAKLQRMESTLALFYTGLTRSASEILSQQKKQVDAKLQVLDFMRDQAEEMYTLLLSEGFTPRFGGMLRDAWEKKRSITEAISNSAIDDMYARALEAGAAGGKLLGAGGGGCLLFYCDEDRQERLEAQLGIQRLPFHIDIEGSKIVYHEQK